MLLGADKQLMANNEEFLEKLKRKEDAGMAKTKEWVSLWQESLRYFFGDQLHRKKEHRDWDWIIVNYIWPAAIQEVAKLSKYPPEIHALPWENADVDAADVWQNALQWHWEKGLNGTGMRMEQIAAILCGKIFGYRVSKIFWDSRCYWDNEKKQWQGEVKHRLWHPAEFWASDSEKIEDGDVGTVRYVELEWAQARWPKYASKLADNASKYRDLTGGGATVRGQIGTSGTYPAQGKGGIDKGIGTSSNNRLLSRISSSDRMSNLQADEDTEFVKLSETYFKDYVEKPQKIEQDVPAEELVGNGDLIVDAGQFLDARTAKPFPLDKWPKRTVKSWVEPEFPNGRYIIRSDDTILNPDKQEQKYPYRRWPFVIVPHYLLPFMWQGINAVQMYKSVQDMINVTVSHLTNNMKMFGDPKIIVERGAIDTPPGRHKEHFRIGKAAGSIIRVVKGAISGKRIDILQPPAPSAAALQLFMLFAQEFKNLQGMQDVAQGKAGTNLTATESSYLAISSHDRISLQNIYETEWVRQCAEMVAEVCQQNYEPGRWIRIVGEDKSQGVSQITQRMSQVRFDIDVRPAPAIPLDSEKRLMKLMKAYELMSLPPNPMLPVVLKELEVPKWKQLLQEHQIWQEFQKFQALYQAVAEGKMQPQEGLRILIEYARQKLGQAMALTPRDDDEKTEIKTEITNETKTDTSTKGVKRTVTETARPAQAG